MKFHASIQLNGKNATGISVPEEIVTQLAAGKRPPVRVSIGSYAYRSTIAPMGGAYMLPVSAEHRALAGVKAGDEVDVEIILDTEPREVDVPTDFAEALTRDEAAKRTFDGLSYSNKLRYTLSIEEAKTAETRLRRIDKAISTLHEG